MLSLRLIAAIGEVVRVLERCGHGEDAAKFLAELRFCEEYPDSPNEPTKRVRIRDEHTRAKDAARAQKLRDKKARHATDSGVTNGVTRRDENAVSRASEPLLFSSFQGDSSKLAAVSQISDARKNAVTPAKSGVTNGVTRRDAEDKNPSPAAAEKVTGREVAKAWNGAVEQKHPGAALHAHRYHREHYELIASVLNAYASPRDVLSALIEWVWRAPNGVSKRVKYPEPKTIAARLDRDLDNAYEWYRSQQHAEAAQ